MSRAAVQPPTESSGESRPHRQPRCAACDHAFEWARARMDRGTGPGRTPTRAPQLHCPHCDAPVAQWHLDLVSDHAAWVWSHGQGRVNLGVGLPVEPPHRWSVVPAPRTPGTSGTRGGPVT